MAYALTILKRAQKELASLPKEDYQRVRDAIIKLADTPRPDGTLKMTGRPAWRIRVGDYRVIYEIDDDKAVISVIHIGHRSDVYR